MKKAKTVTKEKTCAKFECKKTPTACSKSKEDNLSKLVKSGKLEKFVRGKKGYWDHQAWLVLCSEIVEEGYEPIDFDQVGLILEKHKSDLLGEI